MENKKDVAFIDRLGGTVKVAQECEVTKGAVSQWKQNGIPKPHLKFLSLKYPKEYKQTYEHKKDLSHEQIIQ